MSLLLSLDETTASDLKWITGGPKALFSSLPFWLGKEPFTHSQSFLQWLKLAHSLRYFNVPPMYRYLWNTPRYTPIPSTVLNQKYQTQNLYYTDIIIGCSSLRQKQNIEFLVVKLGVWVVPGWVVIRTLHVPCASTHLLLLLLRILLHLATERSFLFILRLFVTTSDFYQLTL